MRPRRTERGTAALELPLAVGLLLVPVALVVVSLPAWPERQTLARAAAAEASRAVALAASWDEGVAEAQAVVADAARNAGFGPGDLTLDLTGGLERGATVTASVTVDMPALPLPLVGTVGRWSWTADHTERVDDYRSLR